MCFVHETVGSWRWWRWRGQQSLEARWQQNYQVLVPEEMTGWQKMRFHLPFSPLIHQKEEASCHVFDPPCQFSLWPATLYILAFLLLVSQAIISSNRSSSKIWGVAIVIVIEKSTRPRKEIGEERGKESKTKGTEKRKLGLLVGFSLLHVKGWLYVSLARAEKL